MIGFDIGQYIDLVDSTLLEFFIFSELDYGDDFDSILLFIIVIDCSINFTVDSWADRLIKCVIFNVFYHFYYRSFSPIFLIMNYSIVCLNLVFPIINFLWNLIQILC